MISFNPIRFVTSIIAKTILSSIGWKSIEETVVNRVSRYDKVVCIYAHTSYLDFFIMLLYTLAYNNEIGFIKTLIKPQAFKYAGGLLTYLGGIPSTRLENRGSNGTVRICEELNKFEKFAFLISPKGSIKKVEWRTGYYHIAKLLNCPLMVATLDYEKKCIITSDSIDPSITSEENCKEFLKDKLSQSVPLYPKSEVFSVRYHDIEQRGIIKTGRVFIIGSIVTIITFYKIVF
jgi:1-acyl-sn-glycerol-3-phosphate acyltransferase